LVARNYRKSILGEISASKPHLGQNELQYKFLSHDLKQYLIICLIATLKPFLPYVIKYQIPLNSFTISGCAVSGNVDHRRSRSLMSLQMSYVAWVKIFTMKPLMLTFFMHFNVAVQLVM